MYMLEHIISNLKKKSFSLIIRFFLVMIAVINIQSPHKYTIRMYRFQLGSTSELTGKESIGISKHISKHIEIGNQH